MISLQNVSKKFGTGVFGLADVTFSVERGEFVFLVGPTGSGKTTLFRLLTREMLPTEGNIVVDEWDIVNLPEKSIPALRKKIGVVFQDLKLFADRTVLENAALPLELIGTKTKEAREKAEEMLGILGISDHRDKFPIQLSGGELQRLAIARALIQNPDILLADEPTGNLDEDTSWEIVKILSDINEKGTTIIMATHNKDIIRKLNKRIIELKSGSLVEDKGHGKKKEEKDDKKEEPKAEEKKEDEKKKEDKEPSADDFEKALKDLD